MGSFFEIYLMTSLFSVPLTIVLLFFIFKGICRFLDATVNKASVEKLNQEIDNISFIELEKELHEYNQKINKIDPWLSSHLRINNQMKDVEKNLKRESRVRTIQEHKSRLSYLEKSLGDFDRNYWHSIFGQRLSSKQVKLESKLRGIFKSK